ncbi:MAG: radical SAM protein, partial [Phycisphaerales bacterium]
MRGASLSIERVIKATRSRCPTCRADIPASVVERGGCVFMEKSCPEHGDFRILLQSDARWYFPSHGDPANAAGACCGGGGCCAPAPGAADATDRNPFDTLSTCVALIEIVESCNLTCPTCYAESPYGVGDDLRFSSFDDVVRRVDAVCARKGTIDILQLSGGEPTIHPEFERILRWTTSHPKVGYVLVNTNAVRIAGDERFRRMLADVRRDHPRFELYVQFDGVQEARVRGDVDQAAQADRAVRGAQHVGDRVAVRVAAGQGRVVGVRQQFRRLHGARAHDVGDADRLDDARPPARRAEHRQRPALDRRDPPAREDGLQADAAHVRACHGPAQRVADFTPLPCGDPNCHTIAYVLRTPGGPVGLSRLIDVPTYAGFLQNRVNYDLEDLARCGCETEPLGELLKALELRPEHPFRIFIKPFMDAWTFDQDRIDRCC